MSYGENQEYETMSVQVPSQDPLTYMGIVFALLQSKESRRQLMLGFKTSLLIQIVLHWPVVGAEVMEIETMVGGGGNGGGQGRAFMGHHPI